MCALPPCRDGVAIHQHVFLINSKWNCKQMKQFHTECIPAARLPTFQVESHTAAIHIHCTVHDCPMYSLQQEYINHHLGRSLGYCYRLKSALKVFYMFFWSDNKSDVIALTRPGPQPNLPPFITTDIKLDHILPFQWQYCCILQALSLSYSFDKMFIFMVVVCNGVQAIFTVQYTGDFICFHERCRVEQCKKTIMALLLN